MTTREEEIEARAWALFTHQQDPEFTMARCVVSRRAIEPRFWPARLPEHVEAREEAASVLALCERIGRWAQDRRDTVADTLRLAIYRHRGDRESMQRAQRRAHDRPSVAFCRCCSGSARNRA